MEAESILYFHPSRENVYKNDAAKRHWWQDAKLRGRTLPQEGGEASFLLVDCPIPPFYYRKKTWSSERLSEAMDTLLQSAPGMTDAFLHPEIMTLVSEKYRERWEPQRETMEKLSAALLAACAADCLCERGEAVVLLGRPEETAWQMEMTAKLLSPYLSRINSLLFYYEEVEGSDIWEETADYLEDYSYEYGLVPGLLPYLAGEGGRRCGREKYGGVILDYSPLAGYPRIRQGERVVYVDLLSDPAKEASLGRKGGQILYASPLKHLDTVVKNSYDMKIYATAMSSATKQEGKMIACSRF